MSTPVRDSEGTQHLVETGVKTGKDEGVSRQSYQAGEERYRLALASTGLGTWSHNLQTDELEVDDRAREHFDLLPGERTTLRSLHERVHPEDRDHVRLEVAAAVAALADGNPEKPMRHEFRILTREGRVRTLAIHAVAQFDGASRPRFTIGTSLDITERQLADEALRRSEERYRTLVENLSYIVYSTDLDGKATFVSAGVARFGVTPDEMIGRRLAEFVHPEDLSAALRRREQVLGGAGGPPLEARLILRGVTYHVRVSSYPTRVKGRVVGATGVIIDMTEQRKIEEQLRMAQKMEAVGRLAGGVAHDFNNLLTVIHSYSEMAVQTLRPEDPLHQDISEVVRAAVRAGDLTRRLLAFSRCQILKPEPLALNSLLENTQRMLQRLIGEDVELVMNTAPNLGTVVADPGQMEQVILNLAVNARDAMPSGGILTFGTANVELDREVPGLPPGPYVELSVSDTGCGMDAATRARAFEPFFTTKALGKGTGLGLATVYGIVHQSGGGIVIESELGRGATFRIFLPRIADPVFVAKTPLQIAAEARGHETILVVEDEEMLRLLSRRVLTAAGYKVLTAANGGEALLLCEQHGAEINLLVTDVIMPRMSGPELARRLGSLCPHMKMLYMSGYTGDAMAQHGLLEPGVQLLEKPWSVQALTEKVRSVLDSGRQSRGTGWEAEKERGAGEIPSRGFRR